MEVYPISYKQCLYMHTSPGILGLEQELSCLLIDSTILIDDCEVPKWVSPVINTSRGQYGMKIANSTTCLVDVSWGSTLTLQARDVAVNQQLVSLPW